MVGDSLVVLENQAHEATQGPLDPLDLLALKAATDSPGRLGLLAYLERQV